MIRNRYIIISNASVTLENLGNTLGYDVIEKNGIGNVDGLLNRDDGPCERTHGPVLLVVGVNFTRNVAPGIFHDIKTIRKSGLVNDIDFLAVRKSRVEREI